MSMFLIRIVVTHKHVKIKKLHSFDRVLGGKKL